MASISLSPTSGSFGTSITVTGTSFAALTGITIKYNSVEIPTTPTTVTTLGDGSFTATITPPSHVYGSNTVSATDGTSTAEATFTLNREPEYCQVKDIADWFRIDISANSDPNTSMVKEYIMMNEDHIDRETGHTWLTDKLYRTDVMHVSDVYDYGHGMWMPLKHRSMKVPFDTTKGDKLEIWNGIEWVEQEVQLPTDNFINFVDEKGLLYIRGYIYTILRHNRFRITYRFGGDKEGEAVPRDIKQCCILLTCIDLLSQDFKFSQISYGGEGNIKKEDIMDKWKKKADKIIWNHNEIITVY